MTDEVRAFWGDTLRSVTLTDEIANHLSEPTVTFLRTVSLPTEEKMHEITKTYLRETIPFKFIAENIDEELITSTELYPVFTPR